MIPFLERSRIFGLARAALAAIAVTVLLAGCGGGGGGGGNSGGGGGTPTTVIVTGQLKDKGTTNVLPSRTVAIQGTALKGTSNTSGNFSISGVSVGKITLVITDSNGVSNGTYGPVDLSKLSGTTRSLGVITLDISGTTPPPPPST